MPAKGVLNSWLTALAKDTKLCLDLLSDVLLHPSFPESEMGEVRDEMLAAIAARFDNPHELANVHFDNLLFGEKHPDGWVLTPDDVKKITRARLDIDYHGLKSHISTVNRKDAPRRIGVG